MKILCAFFLAVIALAFGLPSVEARPQKSKPEATTNAVVADADTSTDSREGLEATKAGDWDRAIESFKRAAEAHPDDKKINYNLGVAYRQRALAGIKAENWDGAIADFTESLKLIDGDTVARRFRAFTYLRKGDLKSALEDYDTVLKEKKGDVEALGRRAFVHMKLKEYDKAIADYSEVIKQQPKGVDAYLGRSYVYELTSKFDSGLADVDAVLKIQPTNSDALNRKPRLEALKKGQPPPGSTPILAGPPIARQPTPAKATTAKPSPAAGQTSSPAPAATASPR